METSQRYNSVPIKNNCALCLPTPYFWSPADPCCHGNEFWDKIDYNSALVKDNCALFAPTPPLYAAARLHSVAMRRNVFHRTYF